MRFNSRLIRNLLFKGEAHVNLWSDTKTRWDKMLPSEPRWDGDRLTFTINTEGKRVPCAISPSALQNLAGHTPRATRDLLGALWISRQDRRDRGHYFHITPEWVDDIDNPPPARVVEVGPKVNPTGACNNGTPQVVLPLVRAAAIPALSRSASR